MFNRANNNNSLPPLRQVLQQMSAPVESARTYMQDLETRNNELLAILQQQHEMIQQHQSERVGLIHTNQSLHQANMDLHAQIKQLQEQKSELLSVVGSEEKFTAYKNWDARVFKPVAIRPELFPSQVTSINKPT
jgi:septal ring factor EnvC (AmiA/AmiB activator)